MDRLGNKKIHGFRGGIIIKDPKINHRGERMKKDTFLTQSHCDRCGKDLNRMRIYSRFTTETLCMDCSNKETELKRKLREAGDNQIPVFKRH